MARITLRQLLDHAAERGYGVPAFNINNMEQGLAIMEAAAGAPPSASESAMAAASCSSSSIPQLTPCALTPFVPKGHTNVVTGPFVPRPVSPEAQCGTLRQGVTGVDYIVPARYAVHTYVVSANTEVVALSCALGVPRPLCRLPRARARGTRTVATWAL